MPVEATLDALNRQMELFDRAAAFPGRPRERMIAVSQAEELFFRLHPYHYRALQLVRVASQITHSSRKRCEILRPCESRLLSHVMRIIRDAGAFGDLDLRTTCRPEDLAFSLWALAFGTRALMDTSVAVDQLGVHNGFKTSRQTMDLLLDALSWRPLSWEWDYERTRERCVAFLLVGQAPAQPSQT